MPPKIRAQKYVTPQKQGVKNLVVIYRPPRNYRPSKKVKFWCKILALILMTLFFVAMKISLFIMICKFVFQEEENLFGFPVKMFSFQKTFWSIQYPLPNATSNGTTIIEQ
jgi:hypothetical protein